MLFFILLMNLASSIYKRILGIQSGILCCGIFGFCLKPSANRRIALQKFKILGLYNKSRGRDASGVFVNGEIIKGRR